MQRHIDVWEVHGYWMYALWIAGRCVVIGRASTYDLAVSRAQLA